MERKVSVDHIVSALEEMMSGASAARTARAFASGSAGATGGLSPADHQLASGLMADIVRQSIDGQRTSASGPDAIATAPEGRLDPALGPTIGQALEAAFFQLADLSARMDAEAADLLLPHGLPEDAAEPPAGTASAESRPGWIRQLLDELGPAPASSKP